MKVEWERPGILRVTARVEEMAALVAGGRIAARALAGTAGEQSASLRQVLDSFDRATARLATAPPAARAATTSAEIR